MKTNKQTNKQITEFPSEKVFCLIISGPSIKLLNESNDHLPKVF